MPNQSEIEAVVHEKITEVLREDGVDAPQFTGRDELTNIGVSSMVFARLAIVLEEITGVDPFVPPFESSDDFTVDDVVNAYVRALGGARSGVSDTA